MPANDELIQAEADTLTAVEGVSIRQFTSVIYRYIGIYRWLRPGTGGLEILFVVIY